MNPIYFMMIVIMSLITMGSCQVDESKIQAGGSGYFNMEEFIRNEIGDTQQIKAVKLVFEKGKLIDSIYLDTYLPTKDLRTFRKADISAPANEGKYKVDTIETGDGKRISYEARDDELNTRKLLVWYSGADVDRIKLRRRFNSVISTIEQNAIFVPDSMYDIHSIITDKVSGDSSDLRVVVKFAN